MVKCSSPGIDTAAYEDTDDAEVVKVLAAVRHCANSWEGSARLVGNVRARDISRACTAAIASLQPAAPNGGDAAAGDAKAVGYISANGLHALQHDQIATICCGTSDPDFEIPVFIRASDPAAPQPGWLKPALEKAAQRASEMPGWMTRKPAQSSEGGAIDDVPSCGQENDYRRARSSAAIETPLAELIAAKANEPAFREIKGRLDANINWPRYLPILKVRPTGVTSWLVMLPSGKEHIIGDEDWQAALTVDPAQAATPSAWELVEPDGTFALTKDPAIAQSWRDAGDTVRELYALSSTPLCTHSSDGEAGNDR